MIRRNDFSIYKKGKNSRWQPILHINNNFKTLGKPNAATTSYLSISTLSSVSGV